MPVKCLLNWSGGKDCSLALYYLKENADIRVEKLLTTISESQEEVSMHGVSKKLLLAQTASIGISTDFIALAESTGAKDYANLMHDYIEGAQKEGFKAVAFGDIFLKDLRKYREDKLKDSGLSVLFPLWKMKTSKLVREFVKLGFKAVVVAVDGSKLDKSFVGRVINDEFIADLPAAVDPCGENGEFHTFVFDGPIFKEAVNIKIGKIIQKNFPSPLDNEIEIPFFFCQLSED